MAQYQDVFQRVEKKYLLSREQYAALNRRLAPGMSPDQYGLHTICNVYYDTEDFSLIRKSLEKPVYKEKLRLRSYGSANAGDTVFVEIKKKYKGIVYKRRVAMKLRDAELFLASGMMRSPMSQIHKEIAYFLSLYPVGPRVYIAYDRIALADADKSGLRITFDRNLRFHTDALTLSGPDSGTLLLPESETLMEIKIPGAMPVSLSRTLSELQIFPVSFSKYGSCYQNNLMQEYFTKGGTRYVA